MYKQLKQVIVKHPKDAFRNHLFVKQHWKELQYLAEPDFREALIEYESFIEILKKYTKNILYLERDDRVGLDSIYAHDPVKFTPKGAIILKSGKLSRQSEAVVYKEFLEKHQIPILGELKGDAVCDGGDIVWLNEKTVAIGRGYRTNQEAIRQLTNYFSAFVEEIKVVQLPHDLGEEACLHLMSFLSIIDEKLAVVYSKLMPVELRQWLLEKGFKLIEVPDEEYENLACNVLAVAPSVCIIVAGNPITESLLKENGVTVYSYKGIEISLKGTGGPTCLTSPVERI
ncbi:MAG: amidinotransferase [Kurthia sp.]|nr:amidinotransferase [Candidatus Kurthia equi]